ncbi:MAG: SPFH domain-containing protein [Candidatus Dormibacteraeota bacterium]|uniref:SPFH domain-containing protein n=1 Tax=Candidatus Dormiibacter inghamiae TaxID=3127013 RepID=A0A934ND34_9BACT|nr:SPFH domain-containing protein [Candidatus Dormibacteraeota bacterium]MBJ7606621.1 SPFH domain-containing protein [Candidatus Dormibacteraeota bacterium]
MGLFGEVRREFIARPDQFKSQILYKWPDQNIRKLTQLTVQQDEMAVFFRDGRVQGTINPGRVTLDSSEIPFLGMLVDFATGGNMFKTELYFISTREFPNLPFGGVVDDVVDPETTLAVGLRVFGEYSLKVLEPQSLIVNLVGTQNVSNNDQITDWMREQLLKVLRTDVTSQIVQTNWPILGIASHTEEIERVTLEKVQQHVASYGIQIVRLGNFTISIKEEDEATLKGYRRDAQYTRMAGGFQQYAQGQAMLGVGEGAAKGGGAVGPAMMGVGFGMGNTMGAGGQQQPGQLQVRCPKCGTANPETAKFCSNCATQLGAPSQQSPAAGVTCPNCGESNMAGAKFCSSCGASLAPQMTTCAKCGTQSPISTKFCPNCGTSLVQAASAQPGAAQRTTEGEAQPPEPQPGQQPPAPGPA